MSVYMEAYIVIAAAFFTIYFFVSTFSQKISINKMFVGMFLSVFWLGVLGAIAILVAQQDDLG